MGIAAPSQAVQNVVASVTRLGEAPLRMLLLGRDESKVQHPPCTLQSMRAKSP